MSLGDLDGGNDDGDFRHDLETGLALNYILNRYRRRHPHGPVRARGDLWGLMGVLTVLGLIGSLLDVGWLAGSAWGLWAFTLMCMGMRHII